MKLKTLIRLLQSLPSELSLVKAKRLEETTWLSVTLETDLGATSEYPTAREISELLTKLGDVDVGCVKTDDCCLQVEIWLREDDERESR